MPPQGRGGARRFPRIGRTGTKERPIRGRPSAAVRPEEARQAECGPFTHMLAHDLFGRTTAGRAGRCECVRHGNIKRTRRNGTATGRSPDERSEARHEPRPAKRASAQALGALPTMLDTNNPEFYKRKARPRHKRALRRGTNTSPPKPAPAPAVGGLRYFCAKRPFCTGWLVILGKRFTAPLNYTKCPFCVAVECARAGRGLASGGLPLCAERQRRRDFTFFVGLCTSCADELPPMGAKRAGARRQGEGAAGDLKNNL